MIYEKRVSLNLCLVFNTFSAQGKITDNEACMSCHKVILVEWFNGTKDHEVLEIRRLFIQMKNEVEGLERISFRELFDGRYDFQISLKFCHKRAMDDYEFHPLNNTINKLASSSMKNIAQYYFGE
ncbi:MAG: hypothetical protein ACX93O_11295 [Flagellimonas sp.]